MLFSYFYAFSIYVASNGRIIDELEGVWTEVVVARLRHYPSISYAVPQILLGYRSGGPGSIPGTTREKKVVGLERGLLSLVSTTEELLDKKVAAPV
jgi:hypothetical protein